MHSAQNEWEQPRDVACKAKIYIMLKQFVKSLLLWISKTQQLLQIEQF